jgi:hypothetical protein
VLAALGALAAISALALGAYYASIVWEPLAAPALVGGRASSFTAVTLSRPGRERALAAVVRQLARCPSIEEIVVVWGGGPPPDAASAFPGAAAPVRVCADPPAESLNDRFRPDPLIKTEAVLIVDDDVLLRCADVERAFGEWRRGRGALVGFYPRLAVPAEAAEAPGGRRAGAAACKAPAGGAHGHARAAGSPPRYRYLQERAVFATDEYNALLTVAEFAPTALLKAYWSDRYAAARARVDELHNCEDLLFNHVAADAVADARAPSSKAAQPALPRRFDAPAWYSRPRRRLDVSKLLGGGVPGISRAAPAAHLAKRERCAADFAAALGPLPPPARVAWAEQPAGRPPCGVPGLGCVYL